MAINSKSNLTFPADKPGRNTTVRPSAAPEWLKPTLWARTEHMVDTLAGPLKKEAHRLHKPQVQEVPEVRRKKEAAVLIALAGEEKEEASVLLTHRSPSMRSHSGQIAFPGGRIDPDDVNVVDAALREANEETGLDREAVTPLAVFGELYIGVTGNPVFPVLAHWHSDAPVGVASPFETDDVFQVPMQELAKPTNRLMVGYKGRHGRDWHGPAFWHEGYLIWGFTGAVLSSLMHQSGWEIPWDQDTVSDLPDILVQSRNNEVIR